MSTYYFSECGNFKLMDNLQSGYSGGVRVSLHFYYSKSVGTGRIKKIDKMTFCNLKGTNPPDIMAYF